MDLTGILVFVFLGLPTPALSLVRDFLLVNEMKNWTEALSYCTENFDEMVTIESTDDSTRVSKLVENSGQPDAWIGLYDDVKSWKWSLDDTPLDEADVGSLFVFEDSGSQHCGSLFYEKLVDNACGLQREYLCYDETTDSIIISWDHKTWQDAQSYCRQTYTDLVTVRNQQDWNWIVMRTTEWKAYWVGLYRDTWKWSDQSETSLSVWAPGEPSGSGEACGSAAVDGWKSLSCDLEIPFICSGPPKRVLKIMLKTDGSVNLNNPLVQEAIVKQMRDDVDARPQEVNKGFMLTLRTQPNGDVFNHLKPPNVGYLPAPCV